jgi:hypothetical protein
MKLSIFTTKYNKTKLKLVQVAERLELKWKETKCEWDLISNDSTWLFIKITNLDTQVDGLLENTQ